MDLALLKQSLLCGTWHCFDNPKYDSTISLDYRARKHECDSSLLYLLNESRLSVIIFTHYIYLMFVLFILSKRFRGHISQIFFPFLQDDEWLYSGNDKWRTHWIQCGVSWSKRKYCQYSRVGLVFCLMKLCIHMKKRSASNTLFSTLPPTLLWFSEIHVSHTTSKWIH